MKKDQHMGSFTKRNRKPPSMVFDPTSIHVETCGIMSWKNSCCAPAMPCGTPKVGPQREKHIPNNEKITKLQGVPIYTRKVLIHQSRKVPNVPDLAKLLAGQPKGTQSATIPLDHCFNLGVVSFRTSSVQA